jgi:hypothetical protein
MAESCFGILMLTIFCVGSVWARHSEVKLWNGGVCHRTGERWRHFDMDSQGGRGYKSGDQRIWISWPGVDKRWPSDAE